MINKDGTWFAGQDGPPGMIMPAQPKVGDVYRPENIPGLVFEQVTVKATGMTRSGPAGKVPGVVAVQECLLDGTLENKQFAPGYGEFRAEVKADQELYHVALSVPTDTRPGPVPAELGQLSSGAAAVFDGAPSGDWAQLTGTVRAVESAWDRFGRGQVPALLHREMDEAVEALETAVSNHRAVAARQAAIDVGQAALDLQLRHRSPADVDRDRLGLWEDQLRLDRAAGDADLVKGDRATLGIISDRIR